MDHTNTIYILGSGAIGFPLAAYLVSQGRSVVAVRTSRADVPPGSVTVTVESGEKRVAIPVETVSLSRLARLDGILVVTAKSYANKALAQELQHKPAAGPIIIMQNGIGVEQPFLAAQFPHIYRCVLYATSQARGEHSFTFRPVTDSPIGIVAGDEGCLKQCVEALTTDAFPFRAEANIEREVWKKAIANTVFNSICPLLEVDNGVFARDEAVVSLALEVVGECVQLTARLGIELSEHEVMGQIRLISRRSDGQLISTLQDLRSGRPTEIESLNLEIARVGRGLQPPLQLPKVELLGKLILAKSASRTKS